MIGVPSASTTMIKTFFVASIDAKFMGGAVVSVFSPNLIKLRLYALLILVVSLHESLKLLLKQLHRVAHILLLRYQVVMVPTYGSRYRPVKLCFAGVSISIFNIVSKLFIVSLLSVATSCATEDIAKEYTDKANGNGFNAIIERRQLVSVSTVLLLAVGIGSVEGLALCFGSRVLLNLTGISSLHKHDLLRLVSLPTGVGVFP
ncbi:hypothetical protein Tco_1431474 [Tanacetum coccineum]